MQDYPVIPVHKITTNSLVKYAEWPEGMPSRNKENDSILFMPEDNTPSGQVTRKVSMRIKNIIKAWNTALTIANETDKTKYNIQGTKLKMITLTLPAQQAHSDKEIKRKPLRVFLQRLARNYNITRWVWKAEKQGNGSIHFHILVDAYLHYDKLRYEWNTCLARLGYIAEYAKKWKEKDKDGFKLHPEFGKSMSRKQQLRAYHKRKSTNYTDPNTTDIHSTRKVQNIEAYMCKYVAKMEPEKRIEGKVWDASTQVKKLLNYTDQETTDISQLIELLDKDPRIRKLEDEYFTAYSGPVLAIALEHCPTLITEMHAHYFQGDHPVFAPPNPPPCESEAV